MERKFHGSESSLYGLFAPGNESAEERKGLESKTRIDGWLGFNGMFSTKLRKGRKWWGGDWLSPFQESHPRLGHSSLSPWPFKPHHSLPKSLYQNTPVSKVRNLSQILVHFRLQHFRTSRLSHYSLTRIIPPARLY